MERNKETVVWTSVYEERGIKGGVGWLVGLVEGNGAR